MDRVGQISMMSNLDVLKEPRGFIKILQFILAIFAFATTTAYYEDAGFKLSCKTENETIEVVGNLDFSYTFRLDAWSHPGCWKNETLTMYGDFSPPSQFYVFVGVMAFLYSLAALVLYVFADDKYHQNQALPCADLVITVIFVLLWLISSSAWADGVSKVKHYTDPNNMYIAQADIKVSEVVNHDIIVTQGSSYASLNVSIIFGFLNMVVWAGNIWFLYKETKWFGGNQEPQQQPQFSSAAVTP